MGLFQGDVIIRESILLGIQDMRENPYLIDHMLEDLVNNVYLKDKYGQRNIDACKEWLANNQIDVYMGKKTDKMRLPSVSITVGPSPEKEEMKHMADLSTEKVILLPNKIGKPISYIMKPFVPTSFDQETGIVGVDPSNDSINSVTAGMILVNPANGTGYVIQDVTPEGIMIEPGIEIEATRLAVVPQFQYYEARIEHRFYQPTYHIGCHAHGDPQNTIWLHSIVEYALCRYFESLLEANGFSQESMSSSDMTIDDFFSTPGGETAWVRYITLTGQVENSWIKSPRRFIESVALKEPTKANSKGFVGGIKILSNLDSPSFVDKTQESWYTDAESEDDPTDQEDIDEQS